MTRMTASASNRPARLGRLHLPICNKTYVLFTFVISDTIEELQELRRLRRKHGGIDVEKLSKGGDKKKKKKPDQHDPWGLQKTLDSVRR